MAFKSECQWVKELSDLYSTSEFCQRSTKQNPTEKLFPALPQPKYVIFLDPVLSCFDE